MSADPWAEVTAARLPTTALPLLAAVRDRTGVRVRLLDEAAWVTWPGGLSGVIECLLPAPGVEFFVRRSDEWFRFQSRVPTSEQPPDDGQPLDAVLLPAKFSPREPDTTPLRKCLVRLVRGGELRAATTIRCSLRELLRWADTAATGEIGGLIAARNGEVAILRGEKLPAIFGATRFWGKDVLFPLGFRPEPDLVDVLRAVAGASADDVVLFDDAGATVIPATAFAPLTRASVRLVANAVGLSR